MASGLGRVGGASAEPGEICGGEERWEFGFAAAEWGGGKPSGSELDRQTTS